jgi:DNA-binding NarL/FixJ family response regulator
VAKTRLLLADDNETMLAGLRQQLGEEFEIVGSVKDGEEAVSAVQRLDPDVLILDISMPVLDGLQAASLLRDAHCRTKIIFLTIHEQREYVSAAFSAGASGYVAKRNRTDLVPAIREVLLGHTFMSPSLHLDCTAPRRFGFGGKG